MQNNILNPSQFLVDNIALLPHGRVLDIAMGRGRNAVFLATMGYSVDGIDISNEAIKGSLELAAKHGVEINANIADLEEGYQIPKDSYDIVICFNYLQRSLLPAIKNGIRPGGVII